MAQRKRTFQSTVANVRAFFKRGTARTVGGVVGVAVLLGAAFYGQNCGRAMNVLEAPVSGGADGSVPPSDTAGRAPEETPPGAAPTPESVVQPIRLLTMGSQFGCYAQGTQVFCFGANFVGQLGRGTTSTERLGVAAVPGLNGTIRQLAVANYNMCAWVDEAIYCWGQNGIFEQARTQPSYVPSRVVFPSGFSIQAFATTRYVLCAFGTVAGSNRLYCWAKNENNPFVAVSTNAASVSLQPDRYDASLGGKFLRLARCSDLGWVNIFMPQARIGLASSAMPPPVRLA